MVRCSKCEDAFQGRHDLDDVLLSWGEMVVGIESVQPLFRGPKCP